MNNNTTQLLIIPGLGGSGENHWQSFWSNKYENVTRINQEDWNQPNLENWLMELNNTIVKLNCPIILVAHSLAVSLVLHWTEIHSNSNIKGALLVAPADVDSPIHTPEILRGFAKMPTSKLPFPSIVVASENDDYVSLERAQYFAEKWGSDFINIGLKGHVNAESKLEFWEEGQIILQKLIQTTNQ
ncbi:alpha/beta hydrolase [Flavobacterium cellulosilyticum]|uniref:Alpha/beta hydrolase n=2 Tax=Flavobacterium cellulosilyticum TaxID=2541731 RepID=A0A4R5CG78_9FLAO|nr:alpha/beta hydrolase [Flavobacterium cellulosilyticum]TDD98049.1 alpha/beta hydrolase [Flavobacterium cellulosilyticum]